MKNSSPLKRDLLLPHAVALVAGTIIGASIFVQPSEITGAMPSIAGASLVWLTAGALTFLGALVCAEWARVFPGSGGVYVYLREIYSPALGFLWGWAMFWTMHSGIIAAIAMIFARYLGYFFEMGAWETRLAALGAIVSLSVVNSLGVRLAGNLQAAMTLVKVLAIATIVLVGFVVGGPAAGSPPETARPVPGFSDFLLALVAGLFAFGGWHMVTYSSEETVDARRTIPRALLIGVGIVTACYVGLNAVYFYILPIETVIGSPRVAADAADVVLGSGGGGVMSALVLLSTFGALSGIILAGPRVYFAMARDRLLFRWFAQVHPVRRTPHRAILLQAVWASVLVLTGTYRALFTRVVYTEWVFFGLLALGLLMPYAAHAAQPSRLVRLGSLIFLVSSFAIVVNQLLADPLESLVGLGFVLTGWPVYHLWSWRQRTR